MDVMADALIQPMLKHRAVVTAILIAALLVNLLVVAQVAPPELDDGVPMAGHCQGGGPGCDVQPLIPPPVGGLPHFDPPAPAVFGQLVAIEPPMAAPVLEAPPETIERPPALTVAI
jgi:hypothetical protein